MEKQVFLHDEDMERIKPIIDFLKKIESFLRDSEYKEFFKSRISQLNYLEFSPLLCVDWSAIIIILHELQDIADRIPLDEKMSAQLQGFIDQINTFNFEVVDPSSQTMLFTVTGVNEMELTECDKITLQKLLQPED